MKKAQRNCLSIREHIKVRLHVNCCQPLWIAGTVCLIHYSLTNRSQHFLLLSFLYELLIFKLYFEWMVHSRVCGALKVIWKYESNKLTVSFEKLGGSNKCWPWYTTADVFSTLNSKLFLLSSIFFIPTVSHI